MVNRRNDRHRISATDLARGLSDVLNRVSYGRESFVVERGGREVCEVSPARYSSGFTGADLVDLLRGLPAVGSDYLKQLDDHLASQPPAEDHRWRK